MSKRRTRVLKGAGVVLGVIAFLCFFLPWFEVDVSVVSAVGKIVGAGRADVLSLSGFDIPRLANSSSSRAAMHVVGLLAPSVKDADVKSYAVWVVPSLALLLGFLTPLSARRRWLALAIALAGLSVSIVAAAKVLTTPLTSMLVSVHLTAWFWTILGCYFGIGLANLALSFAARRRRT